MNELRRHIMMQQAGGILPAEYQQVEYLESTGTQLIDAGCTAKNEYFRIAGELEYTSFVRTDTRVSFILAFGNFYRLEGVTLTLYVPTPNANPSNYGYIETGASYGEQQPVLNLNVGTRYEFDIEASAGKKNGYFGNTLINDVSYTGKLCTRYPFVFFASNNPQFFGYYAFCKIRYYSFKIYHAEGIIRDFVPCYRKSDNVAGMYDIVNDVFYTNAGTGSFAVGPDV